MDDPDLKQLATLLLAPPPFTVAAAESLTCGHLQSLLGEISGSSRYFLGGVTAYSLEAKASLLGLHLPDLQAVNGVSEPVARQMAAAVLGKFNTTLGLATTGYAEAAPALGIPAPFAYWAIACRHPEGIEHFAGRFEGAGLSRRDMQIKTARHVACRLIQILDTLRGSPAGRT